MAPFPFHSLTLIKRLMDTLAYYLTLCIVHEISNCNVPLAVILWCTITFFF